MQESKYIICPKSIPIKRTHQENSLLMVLIPHVLDYASMLTIFLECLILLTEVFLKDTKHLLCILQNVEYTNYFCLETADVNSLYTIIGHQMGLEFLLFSYDKQFPKQVMSLAIA